MPINYPQLKATATRLISENGFVGAILERETDAGYDPITDTGAPVVDQWTVDVVLGKVRTGADTFDVQTLIGTYEIGRLSKALISGETLPVGIEPQPGDRLILGTVIWTVVGNNPVRPNNTPVLHTCYVHR